MMRQPARKPRLQDWPERLAALLEARREAPFAWGENDCALFMADAVAAVTGEDPAAAFRGYASEEEAEAILGADGLEGVVARALAEFGCGDCPPGLAQRGDVALALLGNQPTMVVVLGEVLAGPGPRGLVFLPPARILRAWSV
jgi:2-polyprenyl-6-methoxyphenol hydroxylase-like FAD-dependent oxidoreductase